MESDLAELPGSVIVLPAALPVSAITWSDSVLRLPVSGDWGPTLDVLSNIWRRWGERGIHTQSPELPPKFESTELVSEHSDENSPKTPFLGFAR